MQSYLGNIIRVVLSKPKAVLVFLFLKMAGVETKFGYVNLYGLPVIKKCRGSRIVLGRDVTLVSDPKFNVAGISHPTILATMTPHAEILLEDQVGVSGSAIVAASSIKIGKGTMIGANSHIYDTDFHPSDPIKRIKQTDISEAPTNPVTLEKNVWLCANVFVLKGVNIGENTVVAASSVVVKNISQNGIYAGNPAKLIKKL